jgi:hypothetical protein
MAHYEVTKQQLIMQLVLQTTNSFAFVKINLKYILGWQNSNRESLKFTGWLG